MKKTVLLTGSAGFIGSHLAEAFLRRGDRVIGLDNLDGSYDLAQKEANLAEVSRVAENAGQWEFIEGDIRDAQLVARLFEENEVHAVVHLAAMTGTADSIENPLSHYDINVRGTLNLLNSAQHHMVGNFVFASTSSVYGNTRVIPFVETEQCDLPLTPFSASKRSAEMAGYTYHHLYGLNFTALRLFDVYGPRNRPGSMAFHLAECISRNQKVRLFNKGQIERDWIYISDAVEGLLAATDQPLGYEIVNLGGGKPIMVADFIQQIEQYSGSKANFIPLPLPDMDAPRAFANMEKARRLLGFTPSVSLDEGARHFWRWYNTEILATQTDGVPA